MKRFFDQLSSMGLTTLILAVLMLWFSWGILLAESDTFRQGFNVMNRYLVPAWFSESGELPFLLKVWFVGVCSVMVILGVNLVFCSWRNFLKVMRNKQAASRLVMLMIHIVFGLVALGHFGSFLLGYRYENVKLRQNQSFPLPEGYSVTVKDIHFEGDVKRLDQNPGKRLPSAFHPETDSCEVVLMQNGKPVASGKVYFLRPFVWKSIQVTLKRFTSPKGKGREQVPLKPGVRLIISRNPVRLFVFVLFPVMIVGIGIYMVMTWRMGPSQKINSNGETGGK